MVRSRQGVKIIGHKLYYSGVCKKTNTAIKFSTSIKSSWAFHTLKEANDKIDYIKSTYGLAVELVEIPD